MCTFFFKSLFQFNLNQEITFLQFTEFNRNSSCNILLVGGPVYWIVYCNLKHELKRKPQCLISYDFLFCLIVAKPILCGRQLVALSN